MHHCVLDSLRHIHAQRAVTPQRLEDVGLTGHEISHSVPGTTGQSSPLHLRPRCSLRHAPTPRGPRRCWQGYTTGGVAAHARASGERQYGEAHAFHHSSTNFCRRPCSSSPVMAASCKCPSFRSWGTGQRYCLPHMRGANLRGSECKYGPISLPLSRVCLDRNYVVLTPGDWARQARPRRPSIRVSGRHI